VRKLLHRAPPAWRRWAARLALASALALALGYVPYRILDGSGLARARRLDHELRETRAKIRHLEKENRRLLKEVNALRDDPEAVEEIARHELGMVKENEIVVKIEKDAR
jgi:cell division protein FtsB